MIDTAPEPKFQIKNRTLMKKRFFIGLAGLAIMAAVAVVTVSTINAKTPELSDLMSQNIEALTNNESGGAGTTLSCYETMYATGTTKTHNTYCPECAPRLNSSWLHSSTCPK